MVEVQPSDRKLILAAQHGDRRAGEALVRRYLPLVYNIVGRALSGQPDVDDVVQECMLRIVRDLPELRDPERVRAWIGTILVARISNYRRATQADAEHTVPLEEAPEPGADFEGETILRLQLSGQRREVAEAARWLDEDERLVLSLWWQEAAGRLSRTELAESLGATPAYAAVRVQRMRTQLETGRSVVAALAGDCPGLAAVVGSWDGRPGPLWRKRIARHVRDCPVCDRDAVARVAPERLLLGCALVPVPVALGGKLTATSGTGLISRSARKLWSNPVAAATTATVLAVTGAVAYAGTSSEEKRPAAQTVTVAPSPGLPSVSASVSPRVSASPSSASATPKATTKPVVAAANCGRGAFQAEAVRNGSTWTTRNGDRVTYTGTDMMAAVQTAIDNLTPDRTTKERVVVRGSGTVPANKWIQMRSYTVLDVCGTMTATGEGAYDRGLIYARAVTDFEVQHFTMTGTPMYGIFLRDVTNAKLGQITIKGTYIGVRVDVAKGSTNWSRNVTVDDLTVSGTGSQGMETMRVDGLKVGTVTARNTGESGLLLNTTINADIGTIDADNAGAGTGYAAFRMANRNGRIGDAYPTNIHVGLVKARKGGRGVFCVSESGGAVIDKVDIAATGNHPVLIENCYHVTIKGGTVRGPGDIRLADRAELPDNSDITLKNLTVIDARIVEDPCAIRFTVTAVKLTDATIERC